MNTEIEKLAPDTLSNTRLAPVAQTERLDILDILRGFALIGIILMNIEWFGRPISGIGSFASDLGGVDHAVGWLIRCFVEGKFYKLFALLFGMGFAVMLIRARERNRPFNAWFVRRMLALLVIGLLHMVLLWRGDILHDYAFGGLLFLGFIGLLGKERFKKFDRPASLLNLGIGWMLFPIFAAIAAGLIFGVLNDSENFKIQWQEELDFNQRVSELRSLDDSQTDANSGVDEMPVVTGVEEEAESDAELTPEEILAQEVQLTVEAEIEHDEAIAEELAALTESSYWEAVKYRAQDTLFRLGFTPLFAFFILMPIFILGYWLISSGVMRRHVEHARFFKYLSRIGMGVGLGVTVPGLLLMQHPAGEEVGMISGVGGVLFMTGQYFMAAGYLGIIVQASQSPRWQQALRKLAPMGRMALTNYIMQTLILVLIFHGYAGGFYGEVSRAAQMLIVVPIILFQIVLSGWWLKSFRFGPLEWLWRSLSYMKIQPMRI